MAAVALQGMPQDVLARTLTQMDPERGELLRRLHGGMRRKAA
jgi:hypothetical protein